MIDMNDINHVDGFSDKYLVSVIMPCFNSEEHIQEAIHSVLSQHYRNLELIIVDDNSTDGTIDILSKVNDNRVKIIYSDKNNGAGVSRNLGIEKAKGRFIAFLDSDDRWSENKLSEQIKFMIDNDYYFTYSYYQHFSRSGPGKIIYTPAYTTYKKSLYGNVIGCLTAIYDTARFGKKYMPLIRKRQDFALWLSLLSEEEKAYCCPKILAHYRTDSGMTQNKVNAAKHQWHFYRFTLNYGIMKSLWYFSFYTINGIIKHFCKNN
ncbi:glycosyltransferase family 2 protein [Morganella sp. GD04133]|uniref:glycosyltransferase family 2 protein n=1 Tax=Morganella sp. GD04133 TaxID=2975435 RepID=UPI003261607E